MLTFDAGGWLVAGMMALPLAVAAMKMAMSPGQQVGKRLWLVVLLSVAAAAVSALIAGIGDHVSSSLLGPRLQELLTLPMSPAMEWPLSLLSAVSALGHLLVWLVRVGMLGLLAGMLPSAVAAARTRGDHTPLHTTMAWLLAWAVALPAADSLAAAGVTMIGHGNHLAGLVLLFTHVLTLAALTWLAVLVLTTAVASTGPSSSRHRPNSLG